MKLLAPVSSIESAKVVMKSGADNIYVGMVSDRFSNYSYNGRSIRNHFGQNIQVTEKELSEIVKIVHDFNGQVQFLANIPILHDDGNSTKNTDEYKRYIIQGIKQGVDKIVVGDICSIYAIRDLNINMPIVGSSYLEIQSIQGIRFLESLGLDQAILSYQVKLHEIEKIVKNTEMKIEVFGHGGCSFYVGSCNLFHNIGEDGDGGIAVGYPCRGQYHVSVNGEDKGNHRILDSFKMCSICQLNTLISANVEELKIVGRAIDLEFISSLVSVYRKAMNFAIEGQSLLEVREEIIPAWWQRLWCDGMKRCRQ